MSEAPRYTLVGTYDEADQVLDGRPKARRAGVQYVRAADGCIWARRQVESRATAKRRWLALAVYEPPAGARPGAVYATRAAIERSERHAAMLARWDAGEMPQASDILDVRAVAALIGVAPASVSTYQARGSIPAPDGRVGGSCWWYRATIEAWQAARPGHGGRPRKAAR